MNALRTWRREQDLTIEAMAERLGVSVGSLSRIERDEQWPDRDFFARMETETKGEVTANDFVRVTDAAQRNSCELVNAEAV